MASQDFGADGQQKHRKAEGQQKHRSSVGVAKAFIAYGALDHRLWDSLLKLELMQLAITSN